MTVTIHAGDALTVLRGLESESVQCVVTSPPYYALRDYGVDGQIGLEASPAAFLDALFAVFDEVRRVLRKDGLCFVNLGDSYSGSGKDGPAHDGSSIVGNLHSHGTAPTQGAGIPAKNLLLMPERFAIGMQDRGWWVRSRIAWCKTSAMPESVRDRPASAWEHIWMFSKSARYYYDAAAVAQPSKSTHPSGNGYKRPERLSVGGRGQDEPWQVQATSALRNFWLLGPEPSSLEHYAGFPTEIPKRCILAGSRKGDTVLDPFLGSGTTALVADRLGRHAIGIELSPDYAEMARRRLDSDAPLWSEPVEVVPAGQQVSLWESAV